MFLYFKDELIGVEYLYQQTGKVLQDCKLAIEESETTDVDVELDEGYAELEEFQDITVPTFDTERTPAASSQASVSAASVVPPSAVTSPATSSMSSLSPNQHFLLEHTAVSFTKVFISVFVFVVTKCHTNVN